ncbi:unnamed protein product, partial [Phaeothamnion confervicola]
MDPPKTSDAAAAAITVQRAARGLMARTRVLTLVNEVFEKVYAPREDAYYYYNKHTKEASWERPCLLLRLLGPLADIDRVAPTYADDEAAAMLQAAWRGRLARRVVRRRLADECYEKVFDAETGATYYYNHQTQQATWEKPALLGSEDLEDY